MLLSIVIPCYNEEKSIQLLYKKIIENIDFYYEIIFIDDGSTDHSLDIINTLCDQDSNVHIIALRKNCGKSNSLNIGFNHCKGDVVITMDADLQDDPVEIKNFVAKLNEGYDMVSGWKYHRNDPLEKRIPSKLFNKIISLISGVKLHDFNCGFKAYRKEVIQTLNLYSDFHRLIPVLANRYGFRIAEIKVHHNKREFGKSKYGIERYLKGLFDAMTVTFLIRYYERPLHFFGKIGILSSLSGFIICFYLTILKFQGQPISNKPMLMLGILLIIVGIQIISIGLLGNIFVESNRDNGQKLQNIENYIKVER
jgi:glycosyltransferase involved in cell wall biosynthesis